MTTENHFMEHLPKFNNTAPISIGMYPIRQQDSRDFSFYADPY
jgi:hypothetical protein